MNRAKTDFLARNTDPQIKSYILGQGHNCDISEGAVITRFRYYPHEVAQKGIMKPVKGFMLLPDFNDQWLEDKIWLSSFQDAAFFVNWYNQNHNGNAVLIDSGEV